MWLLSETHTSGAKRMPLLSVTTLADHMGKTKVGAANMVAGDIV